MKAIFVILTELTEGVPNAYHKMSQVRYALGEAVQKCEGAQRIGENAAYLPNESSLPVLGSALNAAERFEIPYRVLFVDSMTEWRRDFSKST